LLAQKRTLRKRKIEVRNVGSEYKVGLLFHYKSIKSRSTSKMKYISAILIGLSVLLLAPPAHACSCVSDGSSLVQLAKKSKLVIRGKVLEYNWYQYDLREQRYKKDEQKREGRPLSMTVEVQEVYKGKMKSRQVVVWGDNGMICRPYVTQFPIATEWVFALSPDSWSKKGEMAISVCGEYALQVQKDRVLMGQGRAQRSIMDPVIGGIPEAKPQVVSLPELRKRLKASR
jgi:hypothetical protein